MPKEKKGNILDIINKREILSVIWSSSTAYTAGQYVAYGNYFYKCIKNTAAGTAPTNATYWEKTNLASEITTLNSNLANIKITTKIISKNNGFSSLEDGQTWLIIAGETNSYSNTYIFYASRSGSNVSIVDIIKTSSNFAVNLYSSRPNVLDIAFAQTSLKIIGIAIKIS